MSLTQTFVIVEGEREVGTVAGLTGAAMVWNENPGARRVYIMAPSGPVGPDPWKPTESSGQQSRALNSASSSTTQM